MLNTEGLNVDWLAIIDTWHEERCGVILVSGEVVELPNRHTQPKNNFRMLSEDVDNVAGDIVSTWHSHTIKNYNLSLNDYYCFKSLPHLSHYIISIKGVACYQAQDDKVMNLNRRDF
jgi:hypothetical protein|tara:strand:- start:2068 stop:2418 length:351 start_codon:yes stop_codon:yes gene_type:complete